MDNENKEDIELFFERERLVEDLLNRVRESRTVFMMAPQEAESHHLYGQG